VWFGHSVVMRFEFVRSGRELWSCINNREANVWTVFGYVEWNEVWELGAENVCLVV